MHPTTMGDEILSIFDMPMTSADEDDNDKPSMITRAVSDEDGDDALTRLPSHQWKEIIDYLNVEDFKALRLTGSKVS
jgi:hypothetical protein